MGFKKQVIAGVCLLGGFQCMAFAGNKVQEKKSENHLSKKEKVKDSCDINHQCFNHSRFQIGPYLNKDRLFDGSKLLIRAPKINEARALLLRQEKLIAECASLGISPPEFPRITVSGQLETQLMYHNPYNAGNYTRFTFDSAELALYLQATDWFSAYVAIDYDPTKTSEKVFMNRGFLTLGNFKKSPFYISAGKMYIPFGRYSSSMVTEPMTRDLGRTLVNSVEVGYQQPGENAFHSDFYLYQGITHYASDHQKGHLEYGADTGYQFTTGKTKGLYGVGILSNLADSSGVNSKLFNGSTIFLTHRVPAIDLYGSLNIDKFTVLGEYITALRRFSANDFSFKNKGADPSALNTELAYAITTFNRPSSIAVGYNQTSEAVAIGLPKRSYRAVYTINLLRDTNLAIEYRHDINYSINDAEGTKADLSQLGKSANAVTAQLDYFF